MTFQIFEYSLPQIGTTNRNDSSAQYFDTGKTFTITEDDVRIVSMEYYKALRQLDDCLLIAVMLKKIFHFEKWLYGWELVWNTKYIDGYTISSECKCFHFKRVM